VVATNNCTTSTNGAAGSTTGAWAVKKGLARMLKGGVIMDVVSPEQAKIAEEAGACASWPRARPLGHPRPRRRRPQVGP
jgi:hypothetical protein